MSRNTPGKLSRILGHFGSANDIAGAVISFIEGSKSLGMFGATVATAAATNPGVAAATGTNPLIAPGIVLLSAIGLAFCCKHQQAEEAEARIEELRKDERFITLLEGQEVKAETILREVRKQNNLAEDAELNQAQRDQALNRWIESLKQENEALLQTLLTENRESAEDIRKIRAEIGLFSLRMDPLQETLDRIDQNTSHRPPLTITTPTGIKEMQHLYTERFVPLVGREKELIELDEFIGRADSFQWWRIINAGGAGKSRIALELAYEYRERGWHTGFLDSESWDDAAQWIPTQNTLIIIDYTFAKWQAEKIAKLLAVLASKVTAYKVRLIVLERSDSHEWWNTFRTRTGASIYGTICHKAYRTPLDTSEKSSIGMPLELGALDDGAILEIFSYFKSEYSKEKLATMLAQFKYLDPAARPLFAGFFADVYEDGDQSAHWSLFTMSERILKRKLLNLQGNANFQIDPQHLNLLLLATMVGGIYDDTDGPPRDKEYKGVLWSQVKTQSGLEGLLPLDNWDYKQVGYFASYSDEWDNAYPLLPALQPDPLGEALVLSRLADQPITLPSERSQRVIKTTESLVSAAAALAPDYSSNWILRVLQDYPGECQKLGFDFRKFVRVLSMFEYPPDMEFYTGLKSLNISFSHIDTLEPLTKCTQLSELDCISTNITTLEPLANCTQLTKLFCGNTKIPNLEPLANCTQLTKLDCMTTQITTLEPLANCTRLTRLYCCDAQITTLEPLAKCTQLTRLYCDNTQITTLQPLAGCEQLSYVNCKYTQITDASCLSHIKGLTVMLGDGRSVKF